MNNKSNLPAAMLFIISICIACISNTSNARSSPLPGKNSPWFTGPILAPSGRTIPNGHTNFEVYSFLIRSNGRYNNQSHFERRPASTTTQYSGIFAHGLTDKVDMSFTFPYTVNRFGGHEDQAVGDMKALLGYQVMTQPEGSWLPNLRITLQENIPTGKFDHLSTAMLSVDDHGEGSYLTTINLNFQTLFEPFWEHYLRTRMAFSFTQPSTVKVFGANHFGGTDTTDGTINPGISGAIDLAAEYTLSRTWVAVVEGFYTLGAPLRFTGNPGVTQLGTPLRFEANANRELSFAPAIEYNFTETVGIIAGTWFSVYGKNISQFGAPVVAVNAYW